MMNIEKANEILNLLNLKLIYRNNIRYLMNNNNDEVIKLNNNTKCNDYFFVKDDNPYYIQLSDKTLSIMTSEGAHITINGDEFLYEVKDEEDKFNLEVVNLTNNSLNYYEKTPIENGFESHGIRAHHTNGEFDYLIISDDINVQTMLKKDIKVRTGSNGPYKTKITRKYNDEGKQITGSLQDELIDDYLSDYILNELNNQSIITELNNKLETAVPGIVDILKNNYKHLNSVNQSEKTMIK